MPPGGGPPPPPPPPGMAGSGGPPPPPPPGGKKAGGGAKAAPKKPVINPSVKMKQVNWSKMTYQQAETTVWAKLDDTSVKLNIADVEAMFGAKTVTKKEEAGPKKPTAITLIDPKKSYNCSIMLTKFKNVPYRMIKEAILSVDEGVIDEDSCNSILQFAPTKEDIDAINSYDGDVSALGKAEQFFKEIMVIPRLTPRLRCICFKMSYYKVLNDIRPDVEAVMKAAAELQNSKKLYKLFEYILAVGNYLNGGSNRGGAFGFKVDSLLKLKDTRSNNPAIPSMLHYIVHLVETNNSELLEFHKDLGHIEHAAKVNSGTVLSQIANLKKGLEEAEREATAAPFSTKEDTFRNVMSAFLIAAKADFKEVEENVNKMDQIFKGVAKLYGEPNAKPEELFNIFAQFMDSFVRAKDENVKKREAAAKAAARKRAQEEAAAAKGGKPIKAQTEATTATALPAARPSMPTDEERGGADNMLAALRSGSAFRRGGA